jgi:hypothetical protein
MVSCTGLEDFVVDEDDDVRAIVVLTVCELRVASALFLQQASLIK